MQKTLIAALLLATSSFAADNALLRNGFSIRHERREVLSDGATTRLFVSAVNSDFVDVPTADIAGFEAVPTEMVPQAGIPQMPKPVTLAEIVHEVSAKTLIDEDLLHSVIQAESAANPRAVSRKGAQGLMQLMPGTAKRLGVTDVFDPQANVLGGSQYLHDLLVHFNFDLARALAAYNSGTEAIARYHGVPPYRETRLYVARIIKDYNRKKLAQAVQRKADSAQTSQAFPPSKS